MADPTLLEEAVADCSLIVGMNEYKELCGLHLGGSSYMSQGTILECTKISANRVAQIVREIKSDISKDSEARYSSFITHIKSVLNRCVLEQENSTFTSVEQKILKNLTIQAT